MIRTLIPIKEVPVTWIFEHYGELDERLIGQPVKIKSRFNKNDTDPSLCISINTSYGNYLFNDFSTGIKGDAVYFVARLLKLSITEAELRIVQDYEKFDKEGYEDLEIKEQPKFKVSFYKTRTWNVLDKSFWTQFHIGTTLLNKFNVRPLSEYVLTKDTDEGLVEIRITGENIYGYFKANGELYKIYRPYNDSYKFINVLPYIQGADQLTYSKPTLLICSSLKDIMAVEALRFEAEEVAPSSENTMLPKDIVSSYLLKYPSVCTLFDNDAAGRRSAEKYKKIYGIHPIYLNLSKDVSDSNRDFGPSKTRKCLKPLIPYYDSLKS